MATEEYLVKSTKSYVLPVTLGCDRLIAVQRKDSEGTPVNWGTVTVHIALDIDKTSPTVINATVTDDEALLHLEEAVCDQTKKNTAWRVWCDDAGVKTPLFVGKIVREDGG